MTKSSTATAHKCATFLSLNWFCIPYHFQDPSGGHLIGDYPVYAFKFKHTVAI